MDPHALSPAEVIAIIKRRLLSLMVPAGLVITAAAAVALLLPAVYRSSATILIEAQEIPADFVTATVTSYVEQRLQSINQRIMSTTRLLEIINRLNLYAELREEWTTEEIVEQMREDIEMTPISTEVTDRRTGRPSAATVAFTLAYEGREPGTVQQVTNLLASLFLEENIQERARQAEETTRFLEDESTRLKSELAQVEAQIAAFKEAHVQELPDLVPVNLQGLHTAEAGVARLQEQLQGLRERAGYLETQLASLPPPPEKQAQKSEDEKRLEELKIQLTHLRSQFSDQYPDVIKTRAEIAELEAQVAAAKAAEPEAPSPDNPAKVTLAAQLASTRVEIAATQRQMEEVEKSMAQYRGRIEASPRVEEQYNTLLSTRRSVQAKYDDLMRKLMEARVASGLEKEQKGERFTLIDPAQLPEKPTRPNRLAILLIGTVLGIGAGVALAALRELADHSVRTPEALAFATALPVLGSIPEMVTAAQEARRRRRMVLALLVGLAVVAGALAAIHFLVMDFDILWAKISHRLAL
ncbi:MAG: GNVR domain-containing protein [Thermodesulfobacteriota bacterium]